MGGDLDDDGFARRAPVADTGEALTPRETEAELSRLITAITAAVLDLAQFRKNRALAYIAWRKAKLRAAHHPECPIVYRGMVTVAERADWIDDLVITEYEALVKADTMQELGIEGLRATLAQAEVTRSLNTSVRAAYAYSTLQPEHQ